MPDAPRVVEEGRAVTFTVRDERWQRRGLLVMVNSRAERKFEASLKMTPFVCTGLSAITEGAKAQSRPRRSGGVVTRVIGMDNHDLFRQIVMYL